MKKFLKTINMRNTMLQILTCIMILLKKANIKVRIFTCRTNKRNFIMINKQACNR